MIDFNPLLYKCDLSLFETTLNSKHWTEKLNTKSQRYRNTKNPSTERLKPSFNKSR